MPEVIQLVPTWEAAAHIYITCLRDGQDEHAKDGAERELIKLAQAYDGLCKDVDEESSTACEPKRRSTINGKPYATMENARLLQLPRYITEINGVTRVHLVGRVSSHDEGLHEGSDVTTSPIESIYIEDMVLIAETKNTRYVIACDSPIMGTQ